MRPPLVYWTIVGGWRSSALKTASFTASADPEGTPAAARLLSSMSEYRHEGGRAGGDGGLVTASSPDRWETWHVQPTRQVHYLDWMPISSQERKETAGTGSPRGLARGGRPAGAGRVHIRAVRPSLPMELAAGGRGQAGPGT